MIIIMANAWKKYNFYKFVFSQNTKQNKRIN